MRLTEKHILWGDSKWVGKKNGFNFEVYLNSARWFCSVGHSKKDIRFNSTWQNIYFKSLEEAHEWCENFNPQNFNCLGTDFKNK